MSNQTKCVERQMQCKCVIMEKPIETKITKSNKQRQECEPARQMCEPARQRCEPARQMCEPARQMCEPARQRCEPARQRCEPARQTCEPARQRCEPGRQTRIPARQSSDYCDWSDSQSSSSTIRNSNFNAGDFTASDTDTEDTPPTSNGCNFACCETTPRSRSGRQKSSKSSDCSALSAKLGEQLKDCLRRKSRGKSSGRMGEC